MIDHNACSGLLMRLFHRALSWSFHQSPNRHHHEKDTSHCKTPILFRHDSCEKRVSKEIINHLHYESDTDTPNDPEKLMVRFSTQIYPSFVVSKTDLDRRVI